MPYVRNRRRTSGYRKSSGAVRKMAKPAVSRYKAKSRPFRRYRHVSPYRRGINLPPVQKVKLKWYEYDNSADLTLAAASFDSLEWRLNGPRDPVYAVGGSTPSFWSTWSGLYGRYMCVGAKVHIKAHVDSASNIGFFCYPVTTNQSALATAIEADQICHEAFIPGAYAKVMSPSKYATSGSYVGNYLDAKASEYRYKHYFNIGKMLGRKLTPSVDGRAVASDPDTTSLCNLQFGIYSPDRGNATALVQYEVWITYYVRFYEPTRTVYTD